MATITTDKSLTEVSTYAEMLAILKCKVQDCYEIDAQNNERFHELRQFVFNSALNENDKSILNDVGKPTLECNIVEAFISRLLGEFSKQEPNVKVSNEATEPLDENLVEFLENHFRHLFYEATQTGIQYKTYQDQLSGGKSSWEVCTEYANSMAFNQNIVWKKTFDPTMVGFDPLAMEPAKGDAEWAFKIFPMRATDFKLHYPKVKTDGLKKYNSLSSFQWSYNNGKEDIVLVCDFYIKEKKRKQIVQLANKKTLLFSKYKKYLEQWTAAGHMGQPATIVNKRWTDITTVVRYRFMETEVLSRDETDFDDLPFIYVDGNSIELKNSGGTVTSMTRPYTYNTIGVQKFMNFMLQTLANECENLTQAKYIMSKESMDADYMESYKDIQKASILVFKELLDENPDIRLTPPIPVQRAPIPPELISGMMQTCSLLQNVLGTFDASLGITNNQLSGIAIQEGATQSNAAAMPFVVGHLHALNQLAKVYLNLMPKYMVTPATVPIRTADGKRQFVKINQPGGVKIEFNANDLGVKVEAGVNFEIQKSKAVQQMVALAGAIPIFAQLIGEEGIGVLVDNLDFRGIDQLKASLPKFMQQMQQQKQQAMQQPNPVQMKMQIDQAKIQQEEQESQRKTQVEQLTLQLKENQDMVKNRQEDERIAIEKQNADTQRMTAIGQLELSGEDLAIQKSKQETERLGQVVDKQIAMIDMHHSHEHEKASLAHDVIRGVKEDEMAAKKDISPE